MTDQRLDLDGRGAYLIKLVGVLHEANINPASPCELKRVAQSASTTTFSLISDQAGLIGELRYLHGRGLVLQSISRVQFD